MSNNKDYKWHADPGHAWLAVSIKELRTLGILRDITMYSYVSLDEKTAFLEEDCDAFTFYRAKKKSQEPIDLGAIGDSSYIINVRGLSSIHCLPDFK
mgnify:CR=1 FL=1